MQRRFRTVWNRAGRSICGLVVATLVAAPALGLPGGYDEAFQACLGQKPEEREQCCTSTANECAAECQHLTESLSGSSEMSPEALNEYLLACQTECATSEGDCTTPPGE